MNTDVEQQQQENSHSAAPAPDPGRPPAAATRLKAERVQLRIEPGSSGLIGALELMEEAMDAGPALAGPAGARGLIGALAHRAAAAGHPVCVTVLGWECEIAAGSPAAET